MNAPQPALRPGDGRESWIPTLQLAMQQVFELMLGHPLAMPSVPPATAGLDITAMVGLAGQLRGIMTVRCSAKSAARMASQMLGSVTQESAPEVLDAVGEICNMVAGNFKNKIEGLGDGCALSVPTVITGADYNLHSTDRNKLQTVLLFEGEPVELSLEIHS